MLQHRCTLRDDYNAAVQAPMVLSDTMVDLPCTAAPTITPTITPTTATPTTTTPTITPTTAAPTVAPTTDGPTTPEPTAAPTTAEPTAAPTTAEPTAAPTTAEPTAAPTIMKSSDSALVMVAVVVGSATSCTILAASFWLCLSPRQVGSVQPSSSQKYELKSKPDASPPDASPPPLQKAPQGWSLPPIPGTLAKIPHTSIVPLSAATVVQQFKLPSLDSAGSTAMAAKLQKAARSRALARARNTQCAVSNPLAKFIVQATQSPAHGNGTARTKFTLEG